MNNIEKKLFKSLYVEDCFIKKSLGGILNYIIENHSSIHINSQHEDEKNNTILHLIAQQMSMLEDSLLILEALLYYKNEEINYHLKNQDGFTAFDLAIYWGNFYFLKNTGFLNTIEPNTYHYFKDIVGEEHHAPILSCLLENSYHIQKKEKQEILDCDIVDYFLEKGANINKTCKLHGESALHKVSDLHIIKKLIDCGADVNLIADYEKTPFVKYIFQHNCCITHEVNNNSEQGQVILYYLEHGANFDFFKDSPYYDEIENIKIQLERKKLNAIIKKINSSGISGKNKKI